MKRLWMSAPLALGFAGVVTLAAQTTATQTPTPGARPATSPAASPAITVTGCLEGPGTPGSNQYVLANASTGPATAATAGTSGSGAPGTTPEMQQTPSGSTNRPASATMARYILAGNADDLTKHRGHRIEVTGTVMPSPPAGPSTDDVAGTSGTGSGAPGTTPEMQQNPRTTAPQTAAGSQMVNNQRLQVTSIKMIAATCP
jgi:hypothetical protein